MKSFFIVPCLVFAFSASATVTCSKRLNNHFAVSLSFSGDSIHAPYRADMNFDDYNACSDEGICTQMAQGTYKVTFQNITPHHSVGAVWLKIWKYSVYDTAGNRYTHHRDFTHFVRTARFTSPVVPKPTLNLSYNGKEYQMDCAVTGN